MDAATPRTEALDCPEPKYAQEIQFDGSRYFAIVPEDYEQFYESHLKLERELIASAERVKVMEEKLADEKARAEHHKAAHQSIKGRATTQHGMEMEARVSQLLERVARLEAALNKIVWIKECGTDVLVDGRLVNATKTERDAMYEVARQALGGAR